MKRLKFPLDYKIADRKPSYKKGLKTDPKTNALFHFCHLFQKL